MLAHLLLMAVAALTSTDSPAMPRVRSSHPYIRAMVAEAQVRSATFRRLVSLIESSDGIVYIEEGDCGHGVHACLPPLVTYSGGFRILRVLIDARQEDWEVMSNIGHELQHAMEVLREPSARTNTGAFFLFYPTNAGSRNRFETSEALRAGDAVRNEVASFARKGSTMGLSR